MADRVPCSKCGASILTETAERTSGVCVPCKNGMRRLSAAAWESARVERLEWRMGTDEDRAYRERFQLDRTPPFPRGWSHIYLPWFLQAGGPDVWKALAPLLTLSNALFVVSDRNPFAFAAKTAPGEAELSKAIMDAPGGVDIFSPTDPAWALWVSDAYVGCLGSSEQLVRSVAARLGGSSQVDLLLEEWKAEEGRDYFDGDALAAMRNKVGDGWSASN